MPGRKRLVYPLPPCQRLTGTGKRGVGLCRCPRCTLLRHTAMAYVGLDSDAVGAVVTRAVAENA